MKRRRLTFAQKAGISNDAVAMDVFSNRAARMGFGTPSVAENAEYKLERYTNDYWLMITLFRNHWLARKIVERPAQDMCKAWPRLQCDLEPDLIAKFDRTVRRTYIPLQIQKAITWANLFGGSGALMVVEGQEDRLDEPLDLDQVNPGSFKGLVVFDRWSGITPKGNVVDDINLPMSYGTPEFYTVNGIDGPLFDIHHSRILRFTGPEVPQPEYQASMYWGISRLEIVYEELRKCDNMDWSILQLMFRAQILTQVNPELAGLISGASASQQAALKYFQVMQAQNELLSNNSMLVLGKDGKLESHQYTFGGVAEILAQKQMYVAGAADMPVSLLFGRTVSGLGQTNDADVRNYEQRISQNQNQYMRPQLESKLYPVVCMSEFGEVPDDMDLVFPSVRVLTEEEKADLAQKAGEYINSTYGAGVISQKIAAKEHKQLSDKTEIMTNIDEEFIDTLDDEVNVPLEIESEEARAGTEEFEEEKTVKGKDSAIAKTLKIQGLPITVETLKGEVRQGRDFSVTMPADYGFIQGTVGADGDEMDCYIGPNPNAKNVVVVYQSRLEDKNAFDEHKCMIGYDNMADALHDYFMGHHKSRDIFMKYEQMSISAFKKWLSNNAK